MYPIMRAMTMMKHQQKHIMHKIKHNIQAITIPKYPGVALAFFLAGVSASHDCSAKTTAVLSRVSVMIQVDSNQCIALQKSDTSSGELGGVQAWGSSAIRFQHDIDIPS